MMTNINFGIVGEAFQTIVDEVSLRWIVVLFGVMVFCAIAFGLILAKAWFG